MSSECVQDVDSARADGLWDRMRAEERADKLEQVAQDAARDAKIATLLDGVSSDGRPS